MRKILVKLFGLILAVGFVYACVNINFYNIFSLPNNIVVTYDDIDFVNKEGVLGTLAKAEIGEISVGNNKSTTGKMWVKLFGIIPIKQVLVEIVETENVYLGGVQLGFAVKTDGLLVMGNNSVLSQEGSIETLKTGEIVDGDIITHINGEAIKDFSQISTILEKNNGKRVNVSLLRNGEIVSCDIMPELDTQSGEYKIGLWVKDDASGIGTLTFVRTTDNKYGALGHAITDYETGVEIPVREGNIYKCSLVGINKATKTMAGELRCIFLQGINTKGTIEKNTKYGVYGVINDTTSVVDKNLTTEVGSRLTVKNGKASIISAVSGVREEYEIEIIKTNYQPENNDKSFVFRVTDKRLLELTGGIVQGMSGSPIMQNGKLIGAVTHVFVNDSTKGYGVYADWMVKNINN